MEDTGPTFDPEARIRRSNRKSRAQLKLEERESLEKILNSRDDENLNLEVKFCSVKGRGIVTKKPFSKGEYLVEYRGELLDIKTAKNMETLYAKDPSKGSYMYYFNSKGKKMCVDATEETGRYGRLINHSRKSANCITKVVLFQNNPRLIIVAKRDLVTGTELLFDYNDRCQKSILALPWLSS